MDADRVEAKRELRRAVRRARAGLDEARRRAASRDASERLLALPALRRARTVLLYAALPEEADPGHVGEVLLDRGVRVLLPRVVGEDLHLARAARDAVLLPGAFGILEPRGPRIDADQVDVAVLPGVAFDRAGTRLGQGRGFYDRLLPTLRPDCVRVGFCFACQVVPRVPREEHDLPVEVIVTEAATHRAHTTPPTS